MVIRRETPSRLCVRDGSREESDNGRGPQEDDRGWVGTLTVYDGLHVRFGSMPCSAGTSTALAGREFAKLDVSVPVLVEGAQKARWAEFVFANEPSRPRGDFLAVVTPPNATPPQ